MKYLIGNWKSNFEYSDIKSYFSILNKLIDNYDSNIELILAVPYLWINQAKDLASKKINICAQNVDVNNVGSFTGCINTKMLKSLVNYVIIGHSETRKYFNEDLHLLNAKIIKCFEAGLNVILCIGEPIDIYNKKTTNQYLLNELHFLFKNIKNDIFSSNLIIAYEPLWAIGTGNVPSNNEIENVSGAIKQYFIDNYNIKMDVLYGGSVNETNIDNFVNIKNIDGFLIGNISLKPNSYFNILNIINNKN